MPTATHKRTVKSVHSCTENMACKFANEHPTKDPLFAATHLFSASSFNFNEDIRVFYKSYIEHLREHGATTEIRNNAEAVAASNIAYYLTLSDFETREMWLRLLPEVVKTVYHAESLDILRGRI